MLAVFNNKTGIELSVVLQVRYAYPHRHHLVSIKEFTLLPHLN
jgi:hypothetical protein